MAQSHPGTSSSRLPPLPTETFAPQPLSPESGEPGYSPSAISGGLAPDSGPPTGLPFAPPRDSDLSGTPPLMDGGLACDSATTHGYANPERIPWNRCRELFSLDEFTQNMPEGLLYHSYLAGEKEPRISSAWLTETDRGLVWDATLGGRVGLWRYGTPGVDHPQGFQWDLEGAAMVRLDPEVNTDVEAVDFRFGMLATFRDGPWAMKAGYYHISSHLGDEFLLRNVGFPRRNYVRDSTIVGLSYDVTDAWRLYGEAGYAVSHEGGALPVEFQYGTEYSSNSLSSWGGPYAAINGHTREDEGWITGVNVVSGWQWRGADTRHRFRVGMQYYTGPALQYSFVGQTETLLGAGLWFDY